MRTIRRCPELGAGVSGSPCSAADSPGIPTGPQMPARRRVVLEDRRCRQNRGSFRRSFASCVGRGLAALRQADDRRAPAERVFLPSGGRIESIRAARCRGTQTWEFGRSGDSGGGTVAEPVDRSAPQALLLVERVDSSDMLTCAYKAGISRGFEFSETCIRCLDPRVEARVARLPDTVGRRSAVSLGVARTASGFGASGSLAPLPPVGGTRWLPKSNRLAGPRARVSRTGRHPAASAGLPSWRAWLGAA